MRMQPTPCARRRVFERVDTGRRGDSRCSNMSVLTGSPDSSSHHPRIPLMNCPTTRVHYRHGAPGSPGKRIGTSRERTRHLHADHFRYPEIEIEWSRPSVRGREVIFGQQIPWGEVWTPGANMATTIRFSKDVVLSGTKVSAGHYSVWLRVLESEPWRLALQAETALPHSAHPPIEEAVLHVWCRAWENHGRFRSRSSGIWIGSGSTVRSSSCTGVAIG